MRTRAIALIDQASIIFGHTFSTVCAVERVHGKNKSKSRMVDEEIQFPIKSASVLVSFQQLFASGANNSFQLILHNNMHQLRHQPIIFNVNHHYHEALSLPFAVVAVAYWKEQQSSQSSCHTILYHRIKPNQIILNESFKGQGRLHQARMHTPCKQVNFGSPIVTSKLNVAHQNQRNWTSVRLMVYERRVKLWTLSSSFCDC